MSFEDILALVKERFKASLTRENLERQIAQNVAIERITAVKLVPIWLKDFIMRRFFAKAEKKYTITFSNLGAVKLPDAISSRVRRFEMLLGASRTHPKKVSVCSYKNELALSFSSTIDDNQLERCFVKFLVDRGVEISISSNETPEPHKPPKQKPRSEKRERRKSKTDNEQKPISTRSRSRFPTGNRNRVQIEKMLIRRLTAEEGGGIIAILSSLQGQARE